MARQTTGHDGELHLSCQNERETNLSAALFIPCVNSTTRQGLGKDPRWSQILDILASKRTKHLVPRPGQTLRLTDGF